MLSRAKSLFERTVLRGGSPYYFARKWGQIVATAPTYVRRKRNGAAIGQGADAGERRVVSELRQAGYAIFEKPLAFTDDLVRECRKRLEEYKLEKRGANSLDLNDKFFWASLVKNDDIAADSIFIHYASQLALLRMAALYLGEEPYLSDISVQYSFETPANPSHSQLWHRDYDDVRMFKVFVYCTDVHGPEDGALHVADRRSVKGIHNSFVYSTRRYNDARFFEIADKSMTKAICGPAGTTFICDTHKSFHFGSRCVKPRLACWFTYQSYAGLYPSGKVGAPDTTWPAELRSLVSA